MRTDDNGECSEDFSVTLRVRAIPSIFNIFFAAVLLVTLQLFSEDPDILADLVHLQEQPAKV